MHVEADHSHSKVKDSTISCDELDPHHENITVKRVWSIYDEASILIVLKNAHVVCW